MKRFFYLDDSGKRKGPYTVEELKDHYLFENTCVWTDGMEKWTIASKVYDLLSIIHKSPPPLDLIDTGEIEAVEIGNQVWTKRNLNVSHFCNGDPIPEVKSEEEWKKAGEEGKPAWCFYDNDSEMGQHYGKLYNWFAVNDPRGLAPAGWHVASDDEWTELIDYVEAQGYSNYFGDCNGAGNALKSCRQINAPNGSACKSSAHPRWEPNEEHHGFDKFGFSALPGGNCDISGCFSAVGDNDCYCWSSTEYYSNAWYRYIGSNVGSVNRYFNIKASGYSVRCIRD